MTPPPADTTESLGPWAPLTVGAARALFAPSSFTWWIAGGHALDLFVGRLTRPHHDLDVSMLRMDAPLLRPILMGWDLQLAHDGTLTPWTSGTIPPEVSSLWCRASPTAPWSLQVMFEAGSPEEWICRRHPMLGVPMHRAVLHTEDGTPYMAPELQLFMKAKDTRPQDSADFAVVFPRLSEAAAEWLMVSLRQFYPTHHWLG